MEKVGVCGRLWVLVPVGDKVGPVIEIDPEMVNVSEVVELPDSLRVSVRVADLVGGVCDGDAEEEMVKVRDLPQLGDKEPDCDLQEVGLGLTEVDEVIVDTPDFE